MVLAMTRPTKRRDCGTLQFRRRTPQTLLSAKRGEKIVFRFPDAGGEIEVTARIGDVIKVSLRTHDPFVAKLRCALANEIIDRYTRAVAARPRRLTNKETVALAGHWYRRGIRDWEDDPGDAEWWRHIERALEAVRERANIAELRPIFGTGRSAPHRARPSC
jgi:hypothetical protein